MKEVSLRQLKRGNNESAYTVIELLQPVHYKVQDYYHGKRDLLSSLYNRLVYNRTDKKLDGAKVTVKITQGDNYAYIVGKLVE